jgi:hypothetical protein
MGEQTPYECRDCRRADPPGLASNLARLRLPGASNLRVSSSSFTNIASGWDDTIETGAHG